MPSLNPSTLLQSGAAALRRLAPFLILLCTAIIFVADLEIPMGFAPWLPYFVLAFAVSRLYGPRTLILATALWSVSIMGEPLLHSEPGELLPQGVFNRGLGVITLWILTGFLYTDLVARRARKVSDSRLQAIVHGALDAVVTMDDRGFVVEWNPRAEVMFGFSRQDALGNQLSGLIIPPQFRGAHAAGLQQFLSTGERNILGRRIETTALRKNGEEFPVELTVTPLHLENQIFFSSFIRDITERRQAEKKIQQSTAFIESMFEHLPNMVFVKDANDLRFVRLNSAGEELLGYSRSELLGKNDYDLFPKEVADFFTSKDRETLLNGRLLDIPEEPVQTKTKGLRILHTKKIPLFDPNHRPQYLLGISEDITERKEAEAALVKARLAAEGASKAKSDFLANMSHEMRTPLNAITGITDFLTRTPLSDEQRSLVHRCAKASDSLLRMIEEVLLAAKLESGTLELIEEPFDLLDAVTECTELLAAEVHEKRLLMTLHLDPHLPRRVIGDAHQLKQILLNVVRNAIKFTPRGSIAVHVAPVTMDGDNSEILCKVVDTGVGIAFVERERIFERFSQADPRTSRQFGGVGLGLSISKQLVESMGGRIWVESVQGEGSTFFFTFRLKVLSPPIVDDRDGRPKKTSPTPLRAIPRSRPPRKLNILLAEDSPESQEVMRLYLRETPHQLDCVATGSDAVARFKAKHYDLVFMDMHMPEMDGYAATRLIRSWEIEEGRSPIPIIAVTANGLSEARHASRAAGCDDFLTKPIKGETVLLAIQRHSRNSAHRGSKQPNAGIHDPHHSVADAVDQLKPTFIRNRHRDVIELKAAIVEQNFDRIRTIGHQIKGLAGSYGLRALGEIGGDLEQAALDRDIEQVAIEVSRLNQAIHEAEEGCSSGTASSSPSATYHRKARS